MRSAKPDNYRSQAPRSMATSCYPLAMGYRNWNAYEEYNEAERRRLPWRQRYAWGRIAILLSLVLLTIGAFALKGLYFS